MLGTAFLLGASVVLAASYSATWPRGALLALALLLPLVLPLPGLLRGDRRTHGWATLCVTPCLIYGITETIANPGTRAVTGAVLLLSLAFFVALVAYLRVTRPDARPQSGPDV